MTELAIPSSIYIIVGSLIVANIGTILAVLVYIFKGGMFVAETRSGIKDAKETGVRAHKRIDTLEQLKLRSNNGNSNSGTSD